MPFVILEVALEDFVLFVVVSDFTFTMLHIIPELSLVYS